MEKRGLLKMNMRKNTRSSSGASAYSRPWWPVRFWLLGMAAAVRLSMIALSASQSIPNI
jgi:hypothetical protein